MIEQASKHPSQKHKRSTPISCAPPKAVLEWGLVLPTALLETRGAKNGAVRRNAVIYFHDHHRVTIVASKAGHARNPAWLADRVFAPYAVYRRDAAQANRTIPIVQLTAREPHTVT